MAPATMMISHRTKHPQVRGYFLIFVQLYGTLTERHTAAIEKVSASTGNKRKGGRPAVSVVSARKQNEFDRVIRKWQQQSPAWWKRFLPLRQTKEHTIVEFDRIRARFVQHANKIPGKFGTELDQSFPLAEYLKFRQVQVMAALLSSHAIHQLHELQPICMLMSMLTMDPY
eukprot:SAG31_NODE_2900_length_4934_cov_2.001448_2_plen_171_part_00